MSDYTSCIIEFKKEYAKDLMPLIEQDKTCFVEGYVTDDTIIVHYNGNHYDNCAEWRAICDKAMEIEEQNEEMFHTLTYSTEYAIAENGSFYDGYAYIGLCVDGKFKPYSSIGEFIDAVKEGVE